jgi:hypothetical protein
MLHATAFLSECEEAAAADRLFIDSVDRKTRIITIQQGADATMADEEDVAPAYLEPGLVRPRGLCGLGVNRPLPAPNADFELTLALGFSDAANFRRAVH